MLNVKKLLAARPPAHRDADLKPLLTPWGQALRDEAAQDAVTPLPEHPRPQAQRDTWVSLNGEWTCAFTEGAPDPAALPLALQGKRPPLASAFAPILVPFSPEAPLSGVGRQLQPTELLWYQRDFAMPAVPDGWRILLHFEAVDHACAVWLNDQLLGAHLGGYLPFSFDVTASLRPQGNCLRLCVADPSDAGTQPRGKQRLDRGGIWYTAQSGIWQPVWLEWMPADGVGDFALDAQFNIATGVGQLQVRGEDLSGVTVRLLDAQGGLVAQGGAGVCAAEVAAGAAAETVAAAAAVTGAVGAAAAVTGAVGAAAAVTLQIEAVRPWSPEDPYLYQVELSRGGDVVRSYCGFRAVEVHRAPDGHKRVFVNGKKVFLKGVLDQGYWPDGLMTAPSDEALVYDIATMKAAGFNLLRKHIKVESARWYYHADRLGMLVWQDMVCGGGEQNQWHTSYKPTFFKASWQRFSDATKSNQRSLSSEDPAYQRQWFQILEAALGGTVGAGGLGGHPSVISWVLFNEGWGQFDARGACNIARCLDRTRPVVAVTGWYDQHCGDFKSVHNYFRGQAVWPDADRGRAFVVGEFGGLTLAVPGHMVLDEAYGYETFEDAEAWRGAVFALLNQMADLEAQGLAGYVYTQLSDVEEEANGLLTYDRRVSKLV